MLSAEATYQPPGRVRTPGRLLRQALRCHEGSFRTRPQVGRGFRADDAAGVLWAASMSAYSYLGAAVLAVRSVAVMTDLAVRFPVDDPGRVALVGLAVAGAAGALLWVAHHCYLLGRVHAAALGVMPPGFRPPARPI